MSYFPIGTRPAYPLYGAKRLHAEINLSRNVAAKQPRYHDRSALEYPLHVFCHVSSAISVEILLLAADSSRGPLHTPSAPFFDGHRRERAMLILYVPSAN